MDMFQPNNPPPDWSGDPEIEVLLAEIAGLGLRVDRVSNRMRRERRRWLSCFLGCTTLLATLVLTAPLWLSFAATIDIAKFLAGNQTWKVGVALLIQANDAKPLDLTRLYEACGPTKLPLCEKMLHLPATHRAVDDPT